MPVYKGRRAGTWRVTLYAANKQHEWIVPGTKKEAESFEARKRVELEANGLPSTRVAPTFSTVCEDVYRPHAEKHLRDSTWRKVRVYQIATLCEHFGALKLTEFNVEAIERFKRQRTVKPSSVNNELRVLRTILNFAATMGYPVARLTWKKLPVRGASRVTVWSSTQIAALLSAVQNEVPEMLPMIVFLANTGCRKGEAIACEWSWIDLAGGMLRIPSNDVWRPKNGMPREVPISDSLRALLSGPRRHAQWVFPSRQGDRYAEFPKDAFARVRAAAGLAGGPHTLRHSFASMFLARQPDMFLLGRILGHSHQRITELYSHCLPDHLQRARNAVDIALPGIPGGETGGEEEAALIH